MSCCFLFLGEGSATGSRREAHCQREEAGEVETCQSSQSPLGALAGWGVGAGVGGSYWKVK